jgi:integration host factor subunit beta
LVAGGPLPASEQGRDIPSGWGNSFGNYSSGLPKQNVDNRKAFSYITSQAVTRLREYPTKVCGDQEQIGRVGSIGREGMNKSQLIERLAKNEGLTVKNTASVVNVVFDSITESLAAGNRVEIRGFGSFKVKDYNSYQGRNPKTGEVIQVREKRLPYFKVGKELKERVDQ